MARKAVVVAIGWVVGALVLAQDAWPWPATPAALARGRAPLALSRGWTGRLVRLSGTAGTATPGDLGGRAGSFFLVSREKEAQVLVFAPDAPAAGTRWSGIGRVRRAPPVSVVTFVCVDTTASRFTVRSLLGLAAILWGAWILVRGVRRARARKTAPDT